MMRLCHRNGRGGWVGKEEKQNTPRSSFREEKKTFAGELT
jgi:hypothetical protein